MSLRTFSFFLTDATPWYDDLIGEDDEKDLELGSKLVILMEIIRNAEAIDDKVLVFSQSILLLNLVEAYLQDNEPSMCVGLDYYRIDGSTDPDARRMWAQNFNKKKNRRFVVARDRSSIRVRMTTFI